jgi:hypothetical protein
VTKAKGLQGCKLRRKLENEGMNPHISKITSTLKVQRAIAEVKTQCIEEFFIPLESY